MMMPCVAFSAMLDISLKVYSSRSRAACLRRKRADDLALLLPAGGGCPGAWAGIPGAHSALGWEGTKGTKKKNCAECVAPPTTTTNRYRNKKWPGRGYLTPIANWRLA